MRSGTTAPGVYSLGRVYHTWLISFVQEQNTENQRRLSQARGCSLHALGASLLLPPWQGQLQDTVGAPLQEHRHSSPPGASPVRSRGLLPPSPPGRL